VVQTNPIQLEVLDSPLLEETNNWGDHAKQWLSNVVDIINASFSTVQNSFGLLITAQGINVGGMGASAIVTVVGLTTTGFVNANIVSTTNTGISISSITPAVNQFTINFSADPGASAIIYYQAFASKPT